MFLSAPLPFKDAVVTSLFGPRGAYSIHKGVDFGVPSGTPVLSVMNGRVLSARDEPALGGTVRLVHADGTSTVYGHLSLWYVRSGQTVCAGQLLGLSGGGGSDKYAGRSRGPHLHFELRDALGRAVNPLPALSGLLRMRR
jgi:murein DD-endopeptidase MepM/ murein hydrolase activator NlpD